jgi:hypothetical protein
MRKFLGLLTTLALLALGAAWWTGQQGGRLPHWYQEARAEGRLAPDLEIAARNAQRNLVGYLGQDLLDDVTADDGTPNESFLDRIKRRGKIVLEGLREGREVRLDARQLEDLMLAAAYEDDRGRQVLKAVRAVRAEILGDELELGAVVAPAELPTDGLSPGQHRLLDLVILLAGSDGEIYVSLRAAPAAVDDQLLLGPPLDLRLGELTLNTSLLTNLGVEAPELESGVPFDVGRVKVRQATLDGDALVLVVSPEL